MSSFMTSVKTRSEEEAGLIISNLKQFKGIRAHFEKVKNDSTKFKNENMFGYVDSVVNEDMERAMLHNCMGYTSKPERAIDLREQLEDKGFMIQEF